MIVKTALQRDDIQQICDVIALGQSEIAFDGKTRDDKFWKWEVKLKLNPVMKNHFRRLGYPDFRTGKQRRIAAVCYHGYYAFAKLLFERDERARIESAMTKKHLGHDLSNREGNFEWEAGKIEGAEIGSVMNPLMYGEACLCAENIHGSLMEYLSGLTTPRKPDYDAWASKETSGILTDVATAGLMAVLVEGAKDYEHPPRDMSPFELKVAEIERVWLNWADSLKSRTSLGLKAGAV